MYTTLEWGGTRRVEPIVCVCDINPHTRKRPESQNCPEQMEANG